MTEKSEADKAFDQPHHGHDREESQQGIGGEAGIISGSGTLGGIGGAAGIIGGIGGIIGDYAHKIEGCFGHGVAGGPLVFPQQLDIIRTVTQWNSDAGNTTSYFNPRQTALYTGMQCEELGEKLRACGLLGFAADLERVGMELKRGVWDTLIKGADLKEMLDADADIMVVTIGSAASQGADFVGAMGAVIGANEAKRYPDGTLHKDENGKIKKPDGWKPADLSPFVTSRIPPDQL